MITVRISSGDMSAKGLGGTRSSRTGTDDDVQPAEEAGRLVHVEQVDVAAGSRVAGDVTASQAVGQAPRPDQPRTDEAGASVVDLIALPDPDPTGVDHELASELRKSVIVFPKSSVPDRPASLHERPPYVNRCRPPRLRAPQSGRGDRHPDAHERPVAPAVRTASWTGSVPSRIPHVVIPSSRRRPSLTGVR
jgi:hypothetical protein